MHRLVPNSRAIPVPAAALFLLMAVALFALGFACVRGGGSATSAGGLAPPNRAEAEARLQGVPRVDLLGPADIAAFKLEGDAKKVRLSTVSVQRQPAQPFTSALRAEIVDGSPSEWSVQLVAANAQPVEKGDAILATFYLRAPAVPEGALLGQTELVFELGRPPYTKSVHYPVQAGGDWVKVQVAFAAAQAFAPGEAHIIFRLGYEPETLEIGGVRVEDFGKRVPVAHLPNTQAWDRQRERDAAAALWAAEQAAAKSGPVEGGELVVEVVPGKAIRPISPLVYGINAQKLEDSGATVRRLGGNRASGYNWELNVSNAGHDYRHNSDQWSCTSLGIRECDGPAAQMLGFATANRGDHVDTMLTIPLLDFVAADKGGPVKESEAAPSPRWVKSVPQKPTPFAATPDPGDGVVYQDELVSHLVGKLGNAKTGGVRFYSLDNEPALWPVTHPRIHPDRTTYAEIVARTEATAAAIAKVDPGAEILAGVMFGWGEFMSLSSAPDAAAENAKLGPQATYIDVLLSQMKRMESVHGRRLVHFLDVHWYPEAKGTKRITDRDTSAKTGAARLQAPRSLWDPTYVEKSWIAAEWGKPIRLIPWLRERIAERYPGTKLAVTEYDYGAGDHISGGLAQADALGVFGREGVDLATYWGSGAAVGRLPGYIKAAFQLYRNYDGKGGAFGDIAVAAAPADQSKASAFAATHSKRDGALTVLVINKEPQVWYDGTIKIVPTAARGGPRGATRGATCATARVFVLDNTGPAIKSLASVPVTNGTLRQRLAPLSATLFVCGAG